MNTTRRRPSYSSEEDDKPNYSQDDLSKQLHLTTLEGKARATIHKAKCLARPELYKSDSWLIKRYFEDFSNKWPVNDPTVRNNIEYVDMEKIGQLEFEQYYIRRKIPCMLLNSQKGWQAEKKWTKSRLMKKYRNQNFKCGEVSTIFFGVGVSNTVTTKPEKVSWKSKIALYNIFIGRRRQQRQTKNEILHPIRRNNPRRFSPLHFRCQLR